ncbi:helix-turn-helix domain-containing protein [Actinomadura barringtoniae]|uniref:Helix-turn-helix domain-containing protein n=1 Tax=Actinomadura barringtoniae TaxID=1427535 RepID=A0A939T7W6_9ACTN|nr:helix-turn-helix transcriptional regulator [Actinomadura barringtoniae]MBO2449707.1 helix-turn-helix domain-containing protein [Actinomadura barringtoniae]
MSEHGSTVRRRAIGKALRAVREEAGYSLAAASRHVERSASSLSIIENGGQLLRPRDLNFILDSYEVDPGLRATLLTLTKQEQQTGWWNEFRDITSLDDRDYVSLENSASRLSGIYTQSIPGLLQTEEYTRSIMRASLFENDPRRAERYVGFRMARQRVLRSPAPPQLHVIIDEAALRRVRSEPGVMSDQLQHLLDRSRDEHVTIQVLSFSSAAAVTHNGTFAIVEVGAPSTLSVVLVDRLTKRISIEDAEEIDRFHVAFRQTVPVALSPHDSRIMIEEVASQL